MYLQLASARLRSKNLNWPSGIVPGQSIENARGKSVTTECTYDDKESSSPDVMYHNGAEARPFFS